MYTHNGLYEQDDDTICKISINPLRKKICDDTKMKILKTKKKNVFDFYFTLTKKNFYDNTTLLYTEISERKNFLYVPKLVFLRPFFRPVENFICDALYILCN
jgi:hypothetical protein